MLFIDAHKECYSEDISEEYDEIRADYYDNMKVRLTLKSNGKDILFILFYVKKVVKCQKSRYWLMSKKSLNDNVALLIQLLHVSSLFLEVSSYNVTGNVQLIQFTGLNKPG